jgi:DNA polymerase (family 10)
MRAEVPAGILEMLRIPGLIPQKVLHTHQKLGVTSLEELQQACRDDRGKTCKGLGASMEAKVLQGIELLRRSQG